MKILDRLADLPPLLGQEVAVTDWLTITQDQIDLFAQATHDHQWIHVDPQRARSGPFGAPIAHGFLTLSLLSKFFEMAVQIRDVRMSVNYGLNKVRFPSPVPVGSRLRARLVLQACDPVDDGGLQVTWRVTIEREGADKPACVAESLARCYA